MSTGCRYCEVEGCDYFFNCGTGVLYRAYGDDSKLVRKVKMCVKCVFQLVKNRTQMTPCCVCFLYDIDETGSLRVSSVEDGKVLVNAGREYFEFPNDGLFLFHPGCRICAVCKILYDLLEVEEEEKQKKDEKKVIQCGFCPTIWEGDDTARQYGWTMTTIDVSGFIDCGYESSHDGNRYIYVDPETNIIGSTPKPVLEARQWCYICDPCITKMTQSGELIEYDTHEYGKKTCEIDGQ